MPFKTIIKDFVEKTPGATGAIMLDWDGETVADFSRISHMDMPAIGAYKGIILNLIKDALKKQKAEDEIKTIGLTTEHSKIALYTIKEGYYFVVTLEKTIPLGRVFTKAKKVIRDLEKEMG